MSEIRERAKIAAKEMIRMGWDRWAATVKDLLAELERVEGNRESECMECEKLACIEIRQQAAREAVELVEKYRAALHIIAHMGISGLSWQHDYEKCVNIAKEALEIQRQG